MYYFCPHIQQGQVTGTGKVSEPWKIKGRALPFREGVMGHAFLPTSTGSEEHTALWSYSEWAPGRHSLSWSLFVPNQGLWFVIAISFVFSHSGAQFQVHDLPTNQQGQKKRLCYSQPPSIPSYPQNMSFVSFYTIYIPILHTRHTHRLGLILDSACLTAIRYFHV